MTEAKHVMRDAKSALKETEGQIRPHRYLAALRSGRVTVDALRVFAGHQYHMWHSDMHSAANLVQRFGDRSYRGFYADDLQGEIAAREGILALACKLDMTEQDLESYEPTAEGFAYAAYFAWLSMFGSAGEVACGLAVNLAAWGHNCGQVSAALRDHYRFSQDDTRFLDDFAALPPLEEAALTIIQDDLERGVAPRQIVRVSRLIQAYERMFRDAMAAAAELSS
jgi:hypothetical protein